MPGLAAGGRAREPVRVPFSAGVDRLRPGSDGGREEGPPRIPGASTSCRSLCRQLAARSRCRGTRYQTRGAATRPRCESGTRPAGTRPRSHRAHRRPPPNPNPSGRQCCYVVCIMEGYEEHVPGKPLVYRPEQVGRAASDSSARPESTAFGALRLEAQRLAPRAESAAGDGLLGGASRHLGAARRAH